MCAHFSLSLSVGCLTENYIRSSAQHVRTRARNIIGCRNAQRWMSRAFYSRARANIRHVQCGWVFFLLQNVLRLHYFRQNGACKWMRCCVRVEDAAPCRLIILLNNCKLVINTHYSGQCISIESMGVQIIYRARRFNGKCASIKTVPACHQNCAHAENLQHTRVHIIHKQLLFVSSKQTTTTSTTLPLIQVQLDKLPKNTPVHYKLECVLSPSHA